MVGGDHALELLNLLLRERLEELLASVLGTVLAVRTNVGGARLCEGESRVSEDAQAKRGKK